MRRLKMEVFYCVRTKTWTDFSDFTYCSDCKESDCDSRRSIEFFGCCNVCGNAQITKEVVEGAECSQCGKLFPKEEGTEKNHRKTGIDETDCDLICEDCEGYNETRESDEKSYRIACLPRRR